MNKQWKAIPYDQKAAQQLQLDLNIHPIFCQLLAQRGISTFEAAKQFFRPSLSDLHDPLLMLGMEKAVRRIVQAIENQEQILIYGDYDADGVTSVALLYSFLSPLHKKLHYYIPDRYKEGYGVSYQAIEQAQQQAIDLIITVDCGITAHGPLKMAQYSGIDCIVCDHHLPGESLPEAFAILDPKQADCEYPYKELSGCGIAFKLAQAINQHLARPFHHCEVLLDLVAISTAADIVEMRGENRVLVHFGLQQLNQGKRLGLNRLIENSGRTRPLSVSDVVFGIAPLINASGRLADAKQAVKLLLATSKNDAADLTRLLELRNKMRREYDQRIAAEASELFQKETDWQEKSSIVLYQKHWHKGVIGIAASRMVEKFHRPSFILTESEGQIVGSARSIKGVNIHNALEACSDLLTNFGGHQYAAGLKMRKENLFFFQDRMEAYLKTQLAETDKTPTINYSAILDFKDITNAFWDILKQFAPFGPGNRNPIFVSRRVKDSGYSKTLSGKHLRLSVKQKESQVMSGIGFGLGEKYNLMNNGKQFDLCYNLQVNRWKGNVSMQMMVKDVKPFT
ncbi:MAG: single-stranded-DNA-specific exonuclease RecJ [Bacteroidota bacterium]